MNQNSSSRGGHRGSQRSVRGQGQGSQGQSQGQSQSQSGAAPPFKLLTRVPQDQDNSPRAGMPLAPGGSQGGSQQYQQQHHQQQQQQQQQYTGHNQSYQYPYYAQQSPVLQQVPPLQQSPVLQQVPPLQQSQTRAKNASRMSQPPPSQVYAAQQPGPSGMDVGMGISNVNSEPPPAGRNASTSGTGGGQGRRERSGSMKGQSGSHVSASVSQQHTQPSSQQNSGQYTLDNGGQSQQPESDAKEHKSRRDRRERSRRDRSSRQPQQSDLSRDDTNSNDGSLKQQQHRVIVDPNSFQRQILQPNPNSSSGSERKLIVSGGSSRGTSDIYDEEFRSSESLKPSNRRQVPAGRTVYSWQGTSTNQQQQQQQPPQQQQQQVLRGASGPYSQPGIKDLRSIGGPNSAGSGIGGAMSAGGRLIQNTPTITAIPPPMGANSVKLMNESGKILETAEQWLSDHPGHFTVGILGTQGAGKSSLLSSFCPSNASSAFTKETPQMMSVAGFQTSGIDMYITPERMILLDTEPIFCLSNLENAIRNERISDGIPLDIWLDHQALILATFLISVCNVVLVMTGERENESNRIFKLLQRVELLMKALSASSSNAGPNTPAQGASTNMASQPGLGQDGIQREGLGDWCADIVLVSNKLSTMQFGIEYYRKIAQEQAYIFQHSNLQLFGSINMAEIFPRFEDCFNTLQNNTSVSGLRKKRLSGLVDSSSSDVEPPQDTEATNATKEQTQPQQQDISHDQRKSAPYLNFVVLPFDSVIASGASTSMVDSVENLSSSLSTSSLQSAMSRLSVSINCGGILGASLKNPYHDIFGTVVQDQERWGVWARGLRNKILSLSMRPQGGPALGSRNRPGMVSEREW
ncbi:smg-9, nonsense mediated mRNA decay factor [Haplosporangium sp. Z 27]|nr:smg-9, nonsense mediated mRNA decay factor [Haplosporangium sp. Z 27]